VHVCVCYRQVTIIVPVTNCTVCQRVSVHVCACVCVYVYVCVFDRQVTAIVRTVRHELHSTRVARVHI